MELLILKICTIFFYLSLVLELTVWHVPSVASSRGIFASEEEIVGVYSLEFQKFFAMPRWKKILFFIVPLAFIYLAYVYPIQLIFGFNFGMKPLFEPDSITTYAACLMILFGRMISLASVWKIRQNNEQKGDSFELHTDGFFGRFRNPGLLGLYISFAGFWLVMPQPFFALCLLIYVRYMHEKVLMEEDFLRNKFGIAYDKYHATTNRYLPLKK